MFEPLSGPSERGVNPLNYNSASLSGFSHLDCKLCVLKVPSRRYAQLRAHVLHRQNGVQQLDCLAELHCKCLINLSFISSPGSDHAELIRIKYVMNLGV